MKRFRPTFLVLTTMGVVWQASAAEPEAAKLDFFEKQVRPILANHCYACHSADTKPAGGLRVDDRNGLLTGGAGGASVVPGKPGESLLLKRVAKDAKKRMPAEGEHLSETQIAVLSKWIAEGAVWPPVRLPTALNKPRLEYEALRRDHWAWQPLRKPSLPMVRDTAWPRSEVDRFVLARLESLNLTPTRDGDRLALIRRITFDLTGVPPTRDEIDTFLADRSSGAFAALVDRLLASPRFGEHWGRHWLDIARYGESTGPSRNIPYPHAWRYRDYVIDTLNTDVPFDRFVQEQIAGDLLPGIEDHERDRLKVATGFLALGVKDVNQRFKVRFLMDNVDEQIDAVTRSILGLTVSCARCHDHKFDPVPQADYYALAGIFTSTENAAGVRNLMGGSGLAYYAPDQLVRLGSPPSPPPTEVLAKLQTEVAEAKKAWDTIRGTPEGLKVAANGQPTQRPYRLKYEKLEAELKALSDPLQRGQAAHGVREGTSITDTEIRIRGEAEKIGPRVARGFLTAFAVPGAPAINPKQSGRLELAQWLTSPANPLTARVFVNRVWSHLFGRGLVSTVDNFGVTGDAPSHPELLDYLAVRWMHEGWSVKGLVRSLVLTRTYQLSCDATETQRTRDPANVFLSRHTPRRLCAEEFRDAILASAGRLDLRRPEGTPAKDLKMVEIRDNGPEAKTIHDAADASRARSVYLPLLRGLTPRTLEAFDPVEQTLVTGARENTTVPAQALFVLNSPFVRRQSLALAEALLKDPSLDDPRRLEQIYRLTLGRTPTAEEQRRALRFVVDYASEASQEVAEALTAPKKPTRGVAKPMPTAGANANPDDVDQSGEPITEDTVRPTTARAAAWLALVQVLYGSAEFRFIQ